MTAIITKFDEELVERSRQFLEAATEHPESSSILERFGFSKAEVQRGHLLVREAERSFEWERAGKAYNFLSPTPERRVAEAKGWYKDTRRRHIRRCLRRAEEAAGWVGEGRASRWPLSRKLTVGTLLAVRTALSAASPVALLNHRTELRKNIAVARADKPAGAPPPKDTVLVELAGWYERWRLLAQRVFRERPDLMAPYGLVPGKPPPRLRSRSARLKYGEKAAGSLSDSGAVGSASDADDVEDALEPAPDEPVPVAAPKTLPIVR